jgi:hypothetical protein
MHDSAATMLDVLVNDRVNHLRKPLRITGYTAALNGTVVRSDDGLNLSYAPAPGYAGVDSFTYTITDAIGGSSTATVTVNVLGTPEVSVRSTTATEGARCDGRIRRHRALQPEPEPVTVTYQTMDGTAAAAPTIGRRRHRDSPAGDEHAVTDRPW